MECLKGHNMTNRKESYWYCPECGRDYKVAEKPYQRPIYGIIMGWIYEKILGYEVEHIIELFRTATDYGGVLIPNEDGGFLMRCTK